MKKITLLFTLLFTAVFVNAQCNAPSNVMMSDVDWDPSLQITWDSNGATQWDIEYGLEDFTPTGVPEIENHAYSSIDFYEFYDEPTTYLDIYVRANCDGETSEWVGPYTFFNYCLDGMWGIPEADFDNDMMPSCWLESNEGTPDTGIGIYEWSTWQIDDFANDPIVSLSAKVNISGVDTNEWLVLPIMKGAMLLKYMDANHYHANYSIALTQADTTEEAILGADDVVQMLISTDFGVTWTVLRTWDATTPISNTGESIYIEYFAYGEDYDLFEQAFLVAFWASSGTEDNANVDFFIDDLTAEPPFSGDIADLASKDFRLYPNPSNNSINLSAKETINNIEIYNHLGQKVKQETLNVLDAQLDIATLPKGIYFMKVQIGETSGIVSLIKD